MSSMKDYAAFLEWATDEEIEKEVEEMKTRDNGSVAERLHLEAEVRKRALFRKYF